MHSDELTLTKRWCKEMDFPGGKKLEAELALGILVFSPHTFQAYHNQVLQWC